MANPCSSGDGVPNPGAGVVSFLTNLAVSAFLSRLGLGWLATVAGALPQFAFDTAEFCSNGQPDLPEITAEDVLALANPFTNPAAGAAGIKVRDLVLHYLWYELCHCEDVDTPSPPAVQDPPDIVGYGQPGSEPCLSTPDCTVTYTYDFIFGSSPAASLWWASNSSAAGCGAFSQTITPRAVKYTVHRERGASGEHEDPFHFRISFQNVFSTTPSNYVDVYAPGDDWEGTYTLSPGVTRTFVTFVPGETETQPEHENELDIMHVQGFLYCDELPGGPTTACCPPDAGILDAINQLRSELALVRTDTTLIQRQGVPFSYVDGDSHFPLTGTGVVTFSEPVLGVRIDLMAVPDRIGQEVGGIYEVFTSSWINFLKDFDPQPRIFLRGFTQLVFPPAAGAMTGLSYTLEPGLSINVTELLREP